MAEEVRSLAQRSAKASKDTAGLIEQSQEKTRKSVEIADRVGNVLNEISERAFKVYELVCEISTASDEQTEGITQINDAINQVDQVTQLVASGAEETASYSEQLNAQARALMESIHNLALILNGRRSGLSVKFRHKISFRKKNENIGENGFRPERLMNRLQRESTEGNYDIQSDYKNGNSNSPEKDEFLVLSFTGHIGD